MVDYGGCFWGKFSALWSSHPPPPQMAGLIYSWKLQQCFIFDKLSTVCVCLLHCFLQGLQPSLKCASTDTVIGEDNTYGIHQVIKGINCLFLHNKHGYLHSSQFKCRIFFTFRGVPPYTQRAQTVTH